MLRFLRNFFVSAPSPKTIAARQRLYADHFSSPPEIYHATDRVFPHIDVYHFKPDDRRDFHTLITGGMAEYQQPVDEDTSPLRLELILCVKTFEWWAANLLKMIAEYPAQQGTFFDAYHTVPIGYRLTDTSEVSAFLLAPVEIEDVSGLAFSVDGEPVTYLLCIPITMIEHAFAREVSAKDLFEKLKDASLLVHIDDERKSIVNYTPRELDEC